MGIIASISVLEVSYPLVSDERFCFLVTKFGFWMLLLASLSATLFPCIPVCAGIHRSTAVVLDVRLFKLCIKFRMVLSSGFPDASDCCTERESVRSTTFLTAYVFRFRRSSWVSFRNFPFPRWTIFLVHALHLVGIDVQVFLPLERLPATANKSVLPGVLLQFILLHLCSRLVCSLFRLFRCWDYYSTNSWDLFQGWIWPKGSGGLISEFSFS